MERRTLEENRENKRDYAVLVGLRSPVLRGKPAFWYPGGFWASCLRLLLPAAAGGVLTFLLVR